MSGGGNASPRDLVLVVVVVIPHHWRAASNESGPGSGLAKRKASGAIAEPFHAADAIRSIVPCQGADFFLKGFAVARRDSCEKI
ncbi:MAG: hypothetical protein DME39_02275 [Verrucomicrobia bacterium]|nr:MAG: hypothetical protein DME39_02275 [Verrucomicrobiota bacterium]